MAKKTIDLNLPTEFLIYYTMCQGSFPAFHTSRIVERNDKKYYASAPFKFSKFWAINQIANLSLSSHNQFRPYVSIATSICNRFQMVDVVKKWKVPMQNNFVIPLKLSEKKETLESCRSIGLMVYRWTTPSVGVSQYLYQPLKSLA